MSNHRSHIGVNKIYCKISLEFDEFENMCKSFGHQS